MVINVFNIYILQEFTNQKYVKKYKIHNSRNSHAFLLTNHMDGDEIRNTEMLVDLMFLGTTYLVRFRAEFNLLWYKLDKLRFKSDIGTLLFIKDVHVEIRFITWNWCYLVWFLGCACWPLGQIQIILCKNTKHSPAIFYCCSFLHIYS